MPKNIVICCDGTANQFGKNNTNVVKLYERIIESDRQPNFYDPGVGTGSSIVLAPFAWLSNFFAQLTGLDVDRNVAEAYLYLMNTYTKGDKVFLFGFSRGAHTVRQLATMLGRLGLLYRGSDNMVPYVTRMYRKDEEADVVTAFRRTYTRECPVQFLGIWDSVSAVPKFLRPRKRDYDLGKNVAHTCHAVAIDEGRMLFRPDLLDEKDMLPGQTVDELWFCGVHSDVGGGYTEQDLSDVPLIWMMERAKEKELLFYEDVKEGLNPDPLGKRHNSWKRPYSWFFWLRRRRQIPKGAKVHRSVETRTRDGKYKPRNLKADQVTWSD